MSKKFVIVHGLVGLLDPLTIDCISRIKNLNEQMLLLFFEQQQLFSDANHIRNYLIRNSLSVCSLLGLNRKTSFSPVQRVYSLYRGDCRLVCSVYSCTGNQHQDQVSQAVEEGTRTSEEWSVVNIV